MLSLTVRLTMIFGLCGWRQHKHLYRKARKLAREIDRIAARKGNGYRERLRHPYCKLLELTDTLLTRAETHRETARKYGIDGGAEALALDKELETYLQRTRQVWDLARRRVIEGETIPNQEKLFSIFETHTQLYKRGKAAQPIQFGRLVLVFEDGAGFITHYHLLPRDQGDRDVVVAQMALHRSATGARSVAGRSTAGFTALRSRRPWPRSSPIHVCPCRGASKRSSRNGRPASSFARRGSHIRASSLRLVPCSRAMD